MAVKPKPLKTGASSELKAIERKWGKALTQAGWTGFPNTLFERQAALGLDPLDINILLHISSYWWEADNKPHPSLTTIANAIGVDRRTVQRRIAKLEASKFIRRQERRIAGKGSRTNVYHFDGLIDAAKPYAEEKIEEIERRRREDSDRPSRKGKPRLSVVK